MSDDIVDLQAPWISQRWMKGQNPFHDLLLDAHERALEQNPPKIEQWWLNQEETALCLALFDQALALYNATITLDAMCIPAYIQKGRLYSLFEQEEDARVTFQLALENSVHMEKKDPRNANALLFQGDALFLLGREEEALNAYEQAIRVAPENPDAHVNKGWLLFTLLKTEALAAYDQALTLTADDSDIYYRKGLLFSEMRRFQEALQNYERAIQLAPTYIPYYEAKCFILSYLGRGQEAYQFAYLEGADLGEANLSGTDLRFAFLGRANLKGTNLGFARLDGAILSEADLRGARLGGGDLQNVNLNEVDLSEANLTDTDFSAYLESFQRSFIDCHIRKSLKPDDLE